jgi:acyl-CoA thioester hydrolase
MSFVWQSPVFFDELDLNGTLHNSRFAVHVERAQSALFEQLGHQWAAYGERDPDLNYVVPELHVEFTAPVTAPGLMPVEIIAEHLGTTSARYGFRCGDHARGHRVIVKVDAATGRPAPWSDWYRSAFAALQDGDTTP